MSKPLRISESQLRKLIKNIIKESKNSITEMMDFDDNVEDHRSTDLGRCDICNGIFLMDELTYNKGICDHCARTPREESDQEVPGLQWSANESRKKKTIF